MRTTTECSYLAGPGPEGMGPLQHVALFQSQDTSRGRGVYCMAMPMERRSACRHCYMTRLYTFARTVLVVDALDNSGHTLL